MSIRHLYYANWPYVIHTVENVLIAIKAETVQRIIAFTEPILIFTRTFGRVIFILQQYGACIVLYHQRDWIPQPWSAVYHASIVIVFRPLIHSICVSVSKMPT